ncbi:MAG TPA: galactokinase family protein, partial [Planctomycetota bacterium]|nr:galactokinase family protein [Planctomycetota bacterium]
MVPTGETFEGLFARPPDARGEAPGRVNLLGDHTDDDGGWVLPCAIPARTVVEVAHRDDDVVEVATTTPPDGHARLNYRIGDERRVGTWLDHVMGVTTALRAEGLPVPGMSVRIAG